MDKTDAVLIVCLIVIGILGSYVWHSTQERPEYTQGYTAGYTEYNVTKYNAACDIEKNFMATSSQRIYAAGYIAGYNAYTNDEDANVLGC